MTLAHKPLVDTLCLIPGVGTHLYLCICISLRGDSASLCWFFPYGFQVRDSLLFNWAYIACPIQPEVLLRICLTTGSWLVIFPDDRVWFRLTNLCVGFFRHIEVEQCLYFVSCVLSFSEADQNTGILIQLKLFLFFTQIWKPFCLNINICVIDLVTVHCSLIATLLELYWTFICIT